MTRISPLQNRVTPFGEIMASPARGLFMGNRGGRIHDPETQMLTRRRWASRRWICCVTAFKNRQRTVMGKSYTELFFLDEVTALAAGHRPCFECRRVDAKAFAAAFAAGQGELAALDADAMDVILQEDRLDGKIQRTYQAPLSQIPDGAVVLLDGQAHALIDRRLACWSITGYQTITEPGPDVDLVVLTPRSICAALNRGYQPHWHPSAARAAGMLQNM